MDHNPIVNLTKAQVEAAAEILSDLTLVAIAGACGVDLSEPFDSEDAMRRLVDATTLGKNIREVVLIFNEFPEGDSTYTVAESLTSHYFRDYVKAKYTSETEHKGELLLDLLRTFLNPVPLYQEAYEYILHEVCDLEAKEQRVKLFRSAYDIAKDRFQEDHEVCLKLFNASRNLGDVLYSRNKNDSVQLNFLMKEMPFSARFTDFRNKVAYTLIPLAEKEGQAGVLRELVASSHKSRPINREAALAFARVIFKRQGICGLVTIYTSFLYHDTSEETCGAIVREMNPLIDADIEKAIANELVGCLLDVWPQLLTWGDGKKRYQRVLAALLEHAVEKKDISILKDMYVTLAKNDEAWDIVSKTLINLAIDVGDAETLKMVTNTMSDGEHRDRAIRARVALIHTQGLLP
ncbi:hypothetical protein A3C89_02550 [Candidatus Kaiserbacteria bacterium RIFCSPHIGHO2_02_FULL_50_50]|uniref:Uncharacterized protein n=1 Tax=Candidatus Kaiserbacteria bacterium RIFCSPHIGHO2_02_FULL_50_50 TaxID=1798492 RepID=A0A1F6DDG8_9BACT|nr:MAG: hypothetical protein A3C89_02550 [Candidatus Kaiserbacteria bacterium RIFCSPHIGHO2_02_FULL_50_50]OGG88176.1 MAG: hypothetical protein A3G62_00255 [Candidatus Kaiserbacteria bacterium RIFCSPLOWO2_12_FULL_50_10]